MAHLIDVRTSEEYATGFLGGAINIPYQDIASFATRPTVKKSDNITLYCRSGRRSDIAMRTLRELGFEHVRDLGGLEAARKVLREEALAGGSTTKGKEDPEQGDNGKEANKKGMNEATRKLLEGLQELDH